MGIAHDAAYLLRSDPYVALADPTASPCTSIATSQIVTLAVNINHATFCFGKFDPSLIR